MRASLLESRHKCRIRYREKSGCCAAFMYMGHMARLALIDIHFNEEFHADKSANQV